MHCHPYMTLLSNRYAYSCYKSHEHSPEVFHGTAGIRAQERVFLIIPQATLKMAER